MIDNTFVKTPCPRLITETPFEHTKIVSYGLIVYSVNTQRVVLVKRKHSVAFLLVLTGQYRPSQLPLFVPNMTSDEHSLLLLLINNTEQYFNRVYVNMIELDEKDLEYSYCRFQESKFVLATLLNNTKSTDLQWTWPKGRLNPDETGYKCALREFKEEVEIDIPAPVVVSKDYYVVESIKTLSCKIVETRCWIYVINNEVDLPMVVNNREVSERKWLTISEAAELLKQPDLQILIDSITSSKSM